MATKEFYPSTKIHPKNFLVLKRHRFNWKKSIFMQPFFRKQYMRFPTKDFSNKVSNTKFSTDNII
jgi:hypothetical protein